MAADITSDDFVAKSSDVLAAEEAALKAAHEKALAELNRIQIEAASKGHNLSPFDDFEMYEATGVGRYVIMRDKGWELVNVDSTIVAQAPKLAPHMAAINASVAKALGVQPDQVNVKAKTAEKLGTVGMGQSMEARAVALLRRA